MPCSTISMNMFVMKERGQERAGIEKGKGRERRTEKNEAEKKKKISLSTSTFTQK